VDQQWNALGALANSVLSQATEARDANADRLRAVEAAQGEVARERYGCVRVADKPASASLGPRQLELPLA